MFKIGDKVRVRDIKWFHHPDLSGNAYIECINKIGVVVDIRFYNIVSFEDGLRLQFSNEEIAHVVEEYVDTGSM